jgi:mRNA-degrading endonuclease toxin of MazEF toxin-antitoxin module
VTNPRSLFPKRGEIYLVKLDKNRPAVILSIDPLNKFALDVCVVPITSKEHKTFSARVLIKKGDGGLDHDCWAKCDQVATIEKSLLVHSLGTLSPACFAKIEERVRFCLGL